MAPPQFHAMPGSAMAFTNALLATVVHTLACLLVTAIAAVVVFEKIGVGVLRKAWSNLDLVWATALPGTGLDVCFSVAPAGAILL